MDFMTVWFTKTQVVDREMGNKRAKNTLFKTKKEGEELLLEACRTGHENKARILIEKYGVDPECGRTDIMRRVTHDSPLILACKLGHLKVVQMLLELGKENGRSKPRVDAKQLDKGKGRNGLHWASKRGHFGVATYLVSRGLDPRLPDREGRTPLMLACWWGHLKLVKFLISGPAGNNNCVNAVEMRRGWSPLHGAVRYNHLKIVDILIQNDIDVDKNDKLGRPPLLHCTRNVEAVKGLVNAGATINVVDPITGRNILHWACEDGDFEVAEFVLSHVANTLNDSALLREMVIPLDKLVGLSPLDLARRNGHHKVVSLVRGYNFFIYQNLQKDFSMLL